MGIGELAIGLALQPTTSTTTGISNVKDNNDYRKPKPNQNIPTRSTSDAMSHPFDNRNECSTKSTSRRAPCGSKEGSVQQIHASKNLPKKKKTSVIVPLTKRLIKNESLNQSLEEVSGNNVGTQITSKKRKLNNTEPHDDDDDEVNDADLTGSKVSFGGEMTPTHESTAMPKMTDPSITFSTKQPANEDLFVLRTWGLVKNEQFLEKVREMISKEVYSEIVNLLSGNKRFENTLDLITFLQMQPQNLVGKFIVAILIVDFCVSAPVQQVLELYNMKSSEIVTGYEVFIENLALLSLHRALRINKDQLNWLTDITIPYNLMIQVDATNVLQSTDSNHLVHTCVESSQAFWVRIFLNELCFNVDDNMKQLNFLDPNFDNMKRLSAWTRLVEAAFVKLDDTNKSLFDELLLMELKLKQSTCCYFIATHDKLQSEVHFHPEVLRRFTDKMPESRQQVSASPKEIKLLTDMLYFPSKDIPNFENKINGNIVDMAKKLNIKYVWQFIFSKHRKVQETKVPHTTLLHCILKANDIEAWSTFMQNPTYYLPTAGDVDEKAKLDNLVGLDQTDVELFVKNIPVGVLKPLKLYDMLLRWAFRICNRAYPTMIEFHEDVNLQFKRVAHLVKLHIYQSEWNDLCKSMYVPINKIVVMKEGS